MAGMRIGFACGNEKLIKFLNDVKYSFNSYTMDRTALAAGVAAVEDKAYFEETCNKIIETREWTKKELKALGFSFQDSKSNFIFATHETCPAAKLFEALRERTFMCVISRKTGLTTSFVSPSEQRKKCRSLLTF